MTSAIHGSVWPMLASSSTRPAVTPPTSTVAPAGPGTARTRCTIARACAE